MMELTEKQLLLVEECGECQFKTEEMAVILQVKVADLRKEMTDEESVVYKRYHTGRLMKERTIRKSINSMAEQGSIQAQELYLKIRDELKVSEA